MTQRGTALYSRRVQIDEWINKHSGASWIAAHDVHGDVIRLVVAGAEVIILNFDEAPEATFVIQGHGTVLNLKLIGGSYDQKVVIANFERGSRIELVDCYAVLTVLGDEAVFKQAGKQIQAELTTAGPQIEIALTSSTPRAEGKKFARLRLAKCHAKISGHDVRVFSIFLHDCVAQIDTRTLIFELSGDVFIVGRAVCENLHTIEEPRLLSGAMETLIWGDMRENGEISRLRVGAATLSVVHQVKRVAVFLTADAQLEISGRGDDVSLSGPGVVKFLDGFTDGLNVLGPGFLGKNRGASHVARDQLPILHFNPFVSVVNIHGYCIIKSARYATLRGVRPHGFTLTDFSRNEDVLPPGALAELFFGASLDRIRVEEGSRSTYIWAALQSAHHVIPSLHNTPVLDHTMWKTFKRFYTSVIRLRFGKDESLRIIPSWRRGRALRERRLNGDITYVRALIDTAAAKGAPGTVKTKANWAAYRLRQRTSPLVESVLLGAYRTIGYGERPAPAFLLWILFSAISTAIILHERSWDLTTKGLFETWSVFSYWALPSFGLTSLPDPPSGISKDMNTFILHAIVAIPFVTGILALRNFLKSDSQK